MNNKVVSEEQLKDRELRNIGSKGLRIQRLFTKPGQDRYEGINFVKRTSKISNPDGSTVFEMKDIEVPDTWSQVAVDILAQKYFRKKGVPQYDEKGNPLVDEYGDQILGSETSAKQTINRLAGAWRWWGEKYGFFYSSEDAQEFEIEIAYMMINKIAVLISTEW